jgi:oligopeptidase B
VQVAQEPVEVSTLIYQEQDSQFAVDGELYVVSLSLSGQYLFIRSSHVNVEYETTEIRFRAVNKPQLEFLIVQQREEGNFYEVKHQGDSFYILSSTAAEPNGTIYKLPIPPVYRYEPCPEPQLSLKQDLSGQFLGAEVFRTPQAHTYIQHLETLRKHIVQVLRDTDTSLQYIQVDNLQSGERQLVTYEQFQGELQVANSKSYRLHLLPQSYDADDFTYRLSTLHHPDRVMSLHLPTRRNKVVKLDKYYPDLRPEDYGSERIVLSANDGERIPVTLIYHKDRLGKKNPVILQTYGSAPVSQTHQFSKK